MNNKTLKYIATLCLMMLFSVNLFAANPTTASLEKAQKAYDQNLYDVAARFYESYIQNSNDKNNTDVLLKLADSYWQMREYKKAKDIYTKINDLDTSKLSASEKIRIANLEARLNDYPKAASWLKDVSGYENRMNSFIDRKKINYITEDSTDWRINPLDINTSYREFSPVLYNNSMVFSSNRPENKEVKANGWDGKNYIKLWMINDKDASGVLKSGNNAQNIKVVLMDDDSKSKSNFNLAPLSSTSNTSVSDKKLAKVYEDSDVKPMETKSSQNSDKFIGKLSAEKSDLVSLLEGLSSLKYNVAAASFDTLNHIYFSANEVLKANESKIILYEGKMNGKTVSEIKPMTVSLSGNQMHPTVNKEGTMLIFANNADGETYDLFLMERNSVNDSWGAPQKLSTDINSVGNEVFPVIADDGFLYFSSDGREGYGGLDIYKVKLSEINSSNPKIALLGYPVNSSADDFGMITDKTGTTGYFTSDRQVENDNIFSFVYDPLPKLSHISGLVKEKKTKKIIPGATVFLLNRTTNEVYVDKTDNKGKYNFDVHNLGDYTIRGIEEDYKDDCTSMNIYSEQPKDVTFQARDLLLELTFKKVFVLNNLFYDFDKWNIRKDAEPPLDTLITILKTYPIKVELGSHTDSRGSDKYNEKLSQRRAESAVNYIIKKGGISPDRITAKGYGESKLTNKCGNGVPCTDEEHQANRRTEITVLSNPTPANSLDPTKYTKGQKLSLKDFPKGYFDNCK